MIRRETPQNILGVAPREDGRSKSNSCHTLVGAGFREEVAGEDVWERVTHGIAVDAPGVDHHAAGLGRGTAAEGKVEEEFGAALRREGPEARSSTTSRDDSVESLEFVYSEGECIKGTVV